MICPGSGKPWGSGTGSPICRRCHLGWRALLLTRKPRKSETVPIHERRTN